MSFFSEVKAADLSSKGLLWEVTQNISAIKANVPGTHIMLTPRVLLHS